MARKSSSKSARRTARKPARRTRRSTRSAPKAAFAASGAQLGDLSRMAKVITPEQAFELYRANAKMALEVINAAIESTAKLRKLQFAGEEEARSMQQKAARHAAEASDAQSLMAAGQAVTQEAVEKAMRLNPHYPSSYAYQRGLALFGLNRLDEAAAALERAIEINRDDYWSQRLLLSIYGLRGRRDDAQRLAESIKLNNEKRGRYAAYDPLSIRAVSFWYPFAKAEDAKRFATGLAKAGIPDY